MVAYDHQTICKSPKSPRFIPVFTLRQALVSLLALAFGLFLLLKHPAFESVAWRPDPMVSLVISDIDKAVSTPPNLNHSQTGNTTYCDLANGRWMPDRNQRPLYTGEFCRRWLSSGWYCRQEKHRNLSYEQYRWQPHGCDLPAFDAAQFLQRMRNQTIAFIGDSLGRQQFQSLICMLTSSSRSKSPADISNRYGLTRGNAAYKFTTSNTTILYSWSSTLAEEQPRPDGSVSLHLDRAPRFLQSYISHFNLVIINTGHHWNRGKMKLNRWLPHMNGKLVEKKMTMAEYRHQTLESCARWLSLKSEGRNGELQVLVRGLSPRHFRGGEWDSGGRCDNFEGIQSEQEFTVDPDAENAARNRVNVRVLEVGYMSRVRGEAHVARLDGNLTGRQDCLHWCLPGVPDAWNELMFGLLVEPSHTRQTSL